MALLEGSEARVRRAGDFDAEFKIGREGVAYLFKGCTDVVLVKGAREEEVRAPFESAWEADRALRLFLISIDPEENSALRTEAAECLEVLLEKKATRTFIENELYSQVLPEDVDLKFFSGSSWRLLLEVLSSLVTNQGAIGERRSAWNALPDSLFMDGDKSAFEEIAIRNGAFRLLACADANFADRNLAILGCYQALAGVPNSRAVVSQWTADFKRPGLKQDPVEEEPEETEEPRAHINAHTAFERAKAQQGAIIEKLQKGNLSLARKYTDQLIGFQLENGGVEYAAKSLCSLAQEAKDLHLYSLQLEFALRAVDINPLDAWAHGQAADALIQFSRLDEALSELDLCQKFGDPQFAATGRARILRHQGKLEEALIAYRAAYKEFEGRQGEQHAWCGAAAVLADLGRLDEAIYAYNAAELRSDLVALNGKASALKDQGNLRQAQDIIAEAIELYPADPVARCQQAEILRLLNDFEGALQLYEFVRANHPTIPA